MVIRGGSIASESGCESRPGRNSSRWHCDCGPRAHLAEVVLGELDRQPLEAHERTDLRQAHAVAGCLSVGYSRSRVGGSWLKAWSGRAE